MDFIDYDLDYSYNGNGGNNPHSSITHSSNAAQTDVLSSYKCVLLNYPVNSTSYSKLTYYSLWLLNANILYPPSEFTPLHHVAYQLSQVILCVYVFVCKKSVVSFIVLSVFALVQGLWGLFVLKSVDVCVWNCVVLGIVLLRLCFSCCDGKGRKSPGGRRVKGSTGGRGVIVSGSSYGVKCGNDRTGGIGGEELRDVYLRLFAPVRVSYKQFLKVVGCKRGFRVLGCGENYSVEKRSRVDSLGLLVSGRLVVCQGTKPLHVILPFQFVDSPEYFGVATDELFQVTITALEESKLLVWHRDKLRLTIMNDEFLSTIFQHILSRDVCRKLISVSDTMVTTPTTTYSSATSTNTAISPSSGGNNPSSSSPPSSSAIPSNGNGAPSNGTTTLLTSLTPTHGTNTITSAAASNPQQPIITLRKEKYSYQPTYLTSLSEEKVNNGQNKINGGFNEEDDDEEEEDELEEDEEEEEEEEEEEDRGLDTVVCGNEKEPMLVEAPRNGVINGDK